jgi:hypothetical protein
MHLVGYFQRCITMHEFMNVRLLNTASGAGCGLGFKFSALKDGNITYHLLHFAHKL